MESLRKNRRANIIFALVILVGVTVFALLNPSGSIRVRIEQESLCIQGPEDTQYSVSLASIQEVTLVSDPVYDEGAQESRSIVYGRYSGGPWGDHFLCANTRIPACLVVESTDGTYVFNYEDQETTQWFYEEFLIYLKEYDP